jgi:hypothetical protein
MGELSDKLDKLAATIDQAVASLGAQIEAVEGEVQGFAPDVLAPLMGFGAEITAFKTEVQGKVRGVEGEIEQFAE